MDAFVSRKKRRIEEPRKPVTAVQPLPPPESPQPEEESTDFKLALLASLHPNTEEATLLEALLVSDGSVEQASKALAQSNVASPKKRPLASKVGYQSSLSTYRIAPPSGGPAKKSLVKKGQTLYLYSPEDIEAHTPCSIIHNFLPAKQADALLLELLEESKTYQKLEFKLFERLVWSPHTFAFYVNSLAEVKEQEKAYTYSGREVQVSVDVDEIK